MPAIEKLLQTSAPADVQRSDALRGIKLVTGEGEQVQAESVPVNGKLSGGLKGIVMKVTVSVRGDAPNFFEGLQGTELVVRMHHRDQPGFLAQGLAQRLRRNESLPINRQIGDFNAALLKRLPGVEHSFMLNRRSDEVLGTSNSTPITENGCKWLCHTK